MRPIRHELSPRSILSLCVALFGVAALACGGNSSPTLPDGGPVPPGDVLCTKSSQCPVGQGCIGNVCTVLPCGGCDSDQVCLAASNTCVPAQGAPCPSVGGCPEGYTCNSNHVCSQPCTLNSDCGAGLVCNSNTCAQCIFDSNCASVAGKPRCEPISGTCVACLQPIDCTTTLGAGHFCDTATHTCAAGCESNGDCNLSMGERCDGATATTPGKCIQCTSATEGSDCTISAPACDATGHCVICTADRYCGNLTPRCDTGTDTCVECLPANNANGSDCGIAFMQGSPKDPHDEKICDPAAKKCVLGCTTDVNCGCLRDPSTGKEVNCLREFTQEHCDPARTSSADQADAGTEGGCVECVNNGQCYCKIIGNQNGSDPSTHLACSGWQGAGSFAGARCQSDVCVAGCDTDADCPSNKLCSLSGPTAHTCVECSCASATINDSHGSCTSASASCGWCSDPLISGQLGGCGPVSNAANAPYKVCDVKTLTCRKKEQNEACTKNAECGDAQDPTIGQCIPGSGFCVLYTGTGDPTHHHCGADLISGRCGIPCVNLGSSNDACVSSSGDCPTGSVCSQATAVSTDAPPGGVQPTGHYCASTQCTH